MPYFAKLDKNNVVEQVIVADSLDWCTKNLGGNWVETFINNPNKNYASKGYTYHEGKDNFIIPKPFLSWAVDQITLKPIPPKPLPVDFNSKNYIWDEQKADFVDVASITPANIEIN